MPTNPSEERADSTRNRAKIRKVILRFIRKELRKPSVQELVEATGLSDKTVKKHLGRIKLGSGPNPYQVLTHDVMMALHARATGYSHPAEKIITVAGPKGCGSSVERHDYIEHYPPDPQSAKLWLQVVEGLTEKQEVNHTGEVKTNTPPAVVQIVRHNPQADDSAQ